ncbi:hypothetical protein DXG01_012686 [Tephrocybe rancida]|nr:hypothetical protein DXG01_012686 [Tephrocybe rancida]
MPVTDEGPLNSLLPEIYPIIIAHLPLYATPSTLLALALTNHHVSDIALPLLCSRLVLKNEADALLLLQKLMDDPPFGRVVRELHIMSDLSLNTRSQNPPSDVVRRVSDVISKGYLPFIHTLGLHLGKGWYHDEDPVNGFGQFEKGFWTQINQKCPKLRALILEGFEEAEEPWFVDSGILEVPDITSLSLHIFGREVETLAIHKHLHHMSSLAHSLHTLDLKPDASEDYASLSSIFEIDFPCLRSLSLASFSEINTSQAMAFWERHPSIEALDIASNDHQDSRWFAPVVPATLLPKLLHLTVCWDDALLLAPILGRLLGLSIHGSVNAQIPYLLRSVCPNGLPKLKSLHIGQAPSSSAKNKNIEGSLWYESEDGVFGRTTNKGSRTVFDGFMHSIVRGAPNLEEIGFTGALSRLPELVKIAGDLNGFAHLKYLYHQDSYITVESGIIDIHSKRDTFASQATSLAENVPGLVSITNVATTSNHLPYMTAKITRGENGEVTSVEVGNGYGMKIGYDDAAFPQAPYNT